jgi:hypothetical protein
MILAARSSSITRRSAFRRLGAVPRAVKRVMPGQRWGLREVVSSAIGELMGLQIGATACFHLINGDLVPEASHHLVWSLSLTLCAITGGAFGWWVARVSRQQPQPVRAK